jgi:methyltransferase (TIGR00027 family)
MKRNKSSNTALIVAAGLQLLQPVPALAAMLPTDAIRRGAALLRLTHPRLAGLLRLSWFRTLCRSLERATLPGITLHFALRKQRLRDHAQAAIADGCRQLVVLGAGLDTMCAELGAAHPALTCIEVDHPATQRIKRDAMDALGQGGHYLGADLAQQRLAAALASHAAFRSDVPTLFVLEGLLMYLPRDAVAALFAQMASCAPASRVAFTWLEPQADGLPNFRQRSKLVDFWLALRGEPFLSGMLRSDLAAFLAAQGYALEAIGESAAVLTPQALAALGSKGLPLAGEYIAFARTARLP